MRIKIKGEITIPELKQALFEQLHELEAEMAIRHVNDITLYITPTNGFGDRVIAQNRYGRQIDDLYCAGPYKSAADDLGL